MVSIFVAGMIVTGPPGCQTGPVIPEAVPVTGTVTYNGEPVVGASVTLISNDPKGKSGGGSTNASGNFSITTYYDPTHILNGAAAGDYRVTVAIFERPPAEAFGSSSPQEQLPQPTLPAKYAKSESTDLKVTVVKGLPPVVFDLKD